MKKFSLFLIAISILSCKSSLPIDYKHNYKAIPKVSLDDYKSVQERDNQDKTIAIGVAVSGGGSRAQYYGTGILIGLDEIQNPNNSNSSFLNEIDYFSTVSGGGFGVGYYFSVKEIGVFERYNSYYDYWTSCDRKTSYESFVYKRANLFSTIFQHGTYERGWSNYVKTVNRELLQKGKKNIYNNDLNNNLVGELFLKNFFVSKNSNINVTNPMFVANGTIYNNVERIPFMPHILKYLKIKGDYFNEDFESTDGYSMPLAYAVTGSASFPGALPILKFKIDQTDQVLRVLDGGVVDNLGYRTLFELLGADRIKDKKNKKALLVSCSGTGATTQYQNEKKISFFGMIEKSLFFAVDSKDLAIPIEMEYQAKFFGLDTDNIKYIGMHTLRNHLIGKLDNGIENVSIQKILPIVDSKSKWEEVYKNFADSFINKIEPDCNGKTNKKYFNLSDIKTIEFDDFTPLQTAQIYALASSIETKVKIYAWEKELLVLAGRYTVYIKRKEIESFLNN